MQIFVAGLGSVYDIENLARLFYPRAQLVQHIARGQDAVAAHWGKFHLLAAVRVNGICHTLRVPTPQLAPGQKPDFVLAGYLYGLLCRVTGAAPPWGMLTGVRPVRLVHDMAKKGMTDTQIEDVFRTTYRTSKEKTDLVMDIARRQRPIIAASGPHSYSLYISIPFCPTRCSYCSFVSRTTAQSADIIEPYLEKLCIEIVAIHAAAQRNHLQLETIYIGGGTPTSLTAPQLEKLLATVRDTFDLSAVREYTVEAGRPDCTDYEKLCLMKQYGVTRISINPQTLHDEVLAAIGRVHSAQDIIDCFRDARRAGHTNINMDLIAGLPRDTVDGFAASLAGVMALQPENITVHTLTLKRASNIVIEDRPDDYADVAAMLQRCTELPAAGWQPYYLYRQKKTLQNLENTGYAKPGFEGLYNIYIMEEVHTILAAGAGASTKFVRPGVIKRVFNYKYPLEYIRNFDEVLQRKEGIDAFYAGNLDTETVGGNQPD